MSLEEAVLQYVGSNLETGYNEIEKKLSALDVDDMLILADQLRTSLPQPTKSKSPFSYIADSSLSGLPYPCAEYECRDSKFEELIAYSSIYADKIVAYNPFSFVVEVYGTEEDPNEYFLRLEMCHALRKAALLLPLLDRKMIEFIEFSPRRFCSDCYSRLISSTLNKKENIDLYFEVISQFANNTEVNVVRRNKDDLSFEIRGDEDLIEHGVYYHIYGKGTEQYQKYSEAELPKRISLEEVIDLQIFNDAAQFLNNDLVSKSNISNEFGVNNIYSSDSEITLLHKIFDEEFIKSNFSIDVPFVAQNSISEILKIRDQEWHHFEEFRAQFHDVTIEQGMSGQAVEQAFSDIVQPELINIEKIVRRSARESNRALIDGAGVSAMSLGASVLTAGASGFLSAASLILGGGHFAKSMVPAIRKRVSEPEDIRDSKLYYAWRVKKI